MTSPAPRSPRARWRAVGADTALVAGAVAFGLLVQRDVLFGEGPHPPLAALDVVAGAASLASTWWLRRRAPVVYTVAGIAVSLVSSIAGAVPLVGVFSVAARRGPGVTAAVTTVAAASTLAQLAIFPVPEDLRIGLGGPLIMIVLAVAGQLRAARRRIVDLLAAQLDDARRAGDERRERVRREERLRLAREMHDALGHRLSLLAVHSGALAFRRDEVGEDGARAAEVVRAQAGAALDELRAVVSVLRDDGEHHDAGAGVDLTEVPGLVAEARAAGLAVALEAAPVAEVPATVGRTAYRVVQEALTNTRRYGRGRAVCVRVGREADALVVEVRESGEPTRPAGGPGEPGEPAGPAGGAGLVGLAERVALAGGVLRHGPEAGGFAVRAELPLRGHP